MLLELQSVTSKTLIDSWRNGGHPHIGQIQFLPSYVADLFLRPPSPFVLFLVPISVLKSVPIVRRGSQPSLLVPHEEDGMEILAASYPKRYRQESAAMHYLDDADEL